MRGYTHLTLQERELLFALTWQKVSLREIGKRLKRSHSTLSRELQRNREYAKLYMPSVAQYYAEQRLQQQRSLARLKSQVIYDYVVEKLKLKWSPETIAGRLPIDHPGMTIHHESIYRFIYWDNGKGLHLWKYLPLARKKRMKKFGRKVIHSKTIPDGISIDHRPKEVQKREIVGHWETDNVIGKHTDTTAISTTVERVTRYTILAKLKKKTAQEKSNSVVNRLLYFPKHVKRSITTDNGFENTKHKEISTRLNIPMYFCHPYSSWEKGTVENMNGRIRRFIPKGKSLDRFSDKDIAAIEYQLNNTPRKCLGYKTPEERMQTAVEVRG
ncbi:MAG TPA: IS30 family transposase [Candidatus Saccharimonadales bacterium]|nr:IS30 family transposase [Candidatus Saccharimonadales bacterium]